MNRKVQRLTNILVH